VITQCIQHTSYQEVQIRSFQLPPIISTNNSADHKWLFRCDQ
jgi:hypothetical protein